MNKFQFVFNSEMKTIGYYTQMNSNIKNEKHFEIKFLIFFMIGFIMVLVFSFLGTFTFKKRILFYNDKKNKALEMELMLFNCKMIEEI